MRIATWNVNSIRQRLEIVPAWLKANDIDVLCMQEIKCMDEAFPREPFESLGYTLAVHGQKTFNGVAIASKYPLEDIRAGLPGMEADALSRYLEALVVTPSGAVRIASIYAPNGNPVGSEKFPYKLAWLKALNAHARSLLRFEDITVLGGDYNIIPEPIDCYDPRAWASDALFQPESRAAYRAFVNLGYTDAFRALSQEPGHYTFWDYQAGAWQKNLGIRIDFMMLSPQAADRLTNVSIDKNTRGSEKPSDHVPVIVDLNV